MCVDRGSAATLTIMFTYLLPLLFQSSHGIIPSPSTSMRIHSEFMYMTSLPNFLIYAPVRSLCIELDNMWSGLCCLFSTAICLR